jgi:hypothetical protein
MKILRAILVSLVALSVAALPVAGGMARAAMTHDAAIAAKGDCCHGSGPCEKQKKHDDCGSMGACALKCFNFSSTLSAPLYVALTSSAVTRLPLPASNVPFASDNPPLPPPRL